jgi:hypothetical protein
MKTEDLLMETWWQWQIDSLSWLSSWMRFDEVLGQLADREVAALCARLKAQ